MQLSTTSTKQLKCCCLEISEIKTMKFIKCLTAWFQIRKTLQLLLKISRRTELDNLYRERNESFYNNESLTTIWQLTSVWIFQTETSSKRCKNRTELIFSIDQRTNHFFRCVYRFVVSLNTRNTFDFSCWFITWWIIWLFLHNCTFFAGIFTWEVLQTSESIFSGYIILLLCYILAGVWPPCCATSSSLSS